MNLRGVLSEAKSVIRDDLRQAGTGRVALSFAAAALVVIGTFTTVAFSAGWPIAISAGITMAAGGLVFGVMTARGTSEAVRAARAAQQTAENLADRLDVPGFERKRNERPLFLRKATFKPDFLAKVASKQRKYQENPNMYASAWARRLAEKPEFSPSIETAAPPEPEAMTVLDSSGASRGHLWQRTLELFGINTAADRPYRLSVRGEDENYCFEMLVTLCPDGDNLDPDIWFVTVGDNDGHRYPMSHVGMDTPDNWRWFISARLEDGRPQDESMLLIAYAVLDSLMACDKVGDAILPAG